MFPVTRFAARLKPPASRYAVALLPNTGPFPPVPSSVPSSHRLFGSSSKGSSPKVDRNHSTVSSASVETISKGDSSECPFTGAKSKKALASNEKSKATTGGVVVPLVQVPSLPYIGSFYLRDLPDVRKPYQFWLSLNQEKGNFYSIGLPGLGSSNSSHGTFYVISSPTEYTKVVRDGGKYPSGIADLLWMNKQWSKDHDTALARGPTDGFMGRGEDWKRIRSFMQTDLLHPDSARGYVPGIMQAAKYASQGAPLSNRQMNTYLNLCAFDMFSTLMFGEYTRTAEKGTNQNAQPDSHAEKENIRFIGAAVQALSTAVPMTRSPYEGFMCRILGIETSKYKHFAAGMQTAWDVGNAKVKTFMERKENGELNEHEQVSYLNRAIDRHLKAGDQSTVTTEEVKEIAFNGIFAAVDTTSGVLGWNVTHLARFPGIQDQVYQELTQAISTTNGELSPEILERNTTPYLHAVVRESHRLTPTVSLAVIKTLQNPVTIHGIQLEEGDVVALDGRSTGMNPDLVEDPAEFRPERWLPEAVASRKGTPQELIDHVFLKEPFSQGARRCPGSRVAANEILILLAQLILDWKFSPRDQKLLNSSSLDDLDFDQKTTVEVAIPDLIFERRS
eukprot:CAMPEP_0195507412 /NCGR_PEP_ID=MMETSP0794_2-20130614/865_1 /TAXON_ID=515487 /ORGANISM="Stephanopyxis turris, Strain CCMP 815" /LENGTH=617 /DNA_ID=CAMNT_0040634087 /DNA_START=31 /DNA_END=1884 /DNA_ORIENTATION=+